MANTDSYSLLIQKLDQFIRKYYINKVIRGALYFIGFSLLLFLLFSIAEHNFYFSKAVRKGMLVSFLAASGISLFYWVLFPLTKFFKLGKTISHDQAASIIGTHFTDVQDKLINILQLKRQADHTPNTDLILASINQKSDKIKLVPFKNAIDLRANRKYLKYALPPLLLFLIILFGAPSIIKDSTFRILNNNEDFERAAPFKFLMEEDEFQVVQYSDFDLKIAVDGTILPDEVFIDVNNYQYRMQKDEVDQFSYTFKNVQKDTPFRIFAGNVKSARFDLNVLEKPNLVDFSMFLNYPSYTGAVDETINNTGDVSVPAGTVASWNFTSEHTENITMAFGSQPAETKRKTDTEFSFSKKLKKSQGYKVYLSNDEIPFPDSFLYTINVIPDQHPSIQVQKFQDSVETNILYFAGKATDDYGLTSLSFHYTIKGENGMTKTSQQTPLNIEKGKTTSYDYILDIEELNLEPGDQLSYYFETYDNDQVNGAKSAKTGLMTFKKASIKEIKEEEEQSSEDVKKSLDEALKESKKIQEEFKKLREKLLQKKEMDWQTRKDLEKLLEKQKELQEKMNQAKENFEKNKKNNEMLQKSEEIQEKQEKMQKLFDELMNDEAKELMEKIQELMQEMEKDEALEMMEDMEMSDEEIETELDRLQELYKQLEVEKEMEDMIDELNKLAEEQEQLAEETEKGEKSKEEIQEEQEKIEEKFDELKEDMKELEEKNSQLERPKEMGDDNEEQMEEISEDMENAQEQMEQNDSQGSSKSQKGASGKMKEMAQQMSDMAASDEMEQMEEDLQAIRQLLENIITLSFDQENLTNKVNRTYEQTPRYVELVQEQFKLQDDFTLIADSLQALAKRQDQIESFVLEKVGDIKGNLRTGIKRLEERAKSLANENQRKTMTGLNDLALMLNESMQNMQQQMSSMMPGSQMCNKPGGKGKGGKAGNKPSDKISEGQQGMKETLQKMMENAKNGKGNSSKDFAKAAAKQAALRKALEEMQKEKGEDGKGSGDMQEVIDQMNKIETDLVNKRLDAELMKRQQDIMTRLLEAEKADRQREKDEKRKAENALDKERKFPPSLEQYIKKREAEIDQVKTVSPALRPYYKFLVEQYYQSLKNE